MPLLKDREREVLGRLLANQRVQTIAAEMCLSPHTVRNYLKSIYQKTGIHGQVALVKRLAPARSLSPALTSNLPRETRTASPPPE